MPLKECPACGISHGPRKKLCDCGHDFQVKTTKGKPGDTALSLGAWILDRDKSLPEIKPPDPLPTDHKLNKSELQDFCAYDGLGFCIHEYIPASKIADAKLAKLWTKAKKAMIEVAEELYE